MSGLFPRWQRTAGCGVVSVAAMLTCLWFRSAITFDNVSILVGTRRHSLESLGGYLVWASVDYSPKYDLPNPIAWSQFSALQMPANITVPQWIANENEFEAPYSHRYWIVPYLVLVLSLSAVAAVLLLWRS